MKTLEPIEATVVVESRRMSILPKYLGVRFMMRGEGLIYDFMRKLNAAYSGGEWEMVEVSNESFYMRERSPDFVWLTGLNQTTKRVSRDAAGITATLYALGALSELTTADHIIELYHRLLDFVDRHPEVAAIKTLIN